MAYEKRYFCNGLLICSLVCTGMAGAAIAAHFAFASLSIWVVLKAWILGIFLLLMPHAIVKLQSSRKYRFGHHIKYAMAALATATVLVTASGWNSSIDQIIFAIITLGALASIFVLIRDLSKSNLWIIAFSVTTALIFTCWLAGVYWSGVSRNLYFISNISTGTGHPDGLMHIAIAKMIQTYGVPSSGLDGIPYAFYHYGSHVVFARLATMLGSDLTDFYSLAIPIFLPTLGLAAILTFCGGLTWLNEAQDKSAGQIGANIAFVTSTLILIVGFLGPWDQKTLDMSSIWSSSYFSGESNIFAFSIALLALTYICKICHDRVQQSSQPPSDDYIFLVFGIPVLLFALGVIKISIAVLGLGAVGYYALRTATIRYWVWEAMLVVLSVVAVLAAYFLANKGLTSVQIAFNGTFNIYIREGYIFVYGITYFGWLIALTIGRWAESHDGFMPSSIARFRSGQFWDIELLFIMSCVALLPGMFTKGMNSSTFWFSDVPYRLSIFLLAGFAGRMFLHRNPLSSVKSLLRTYGALAGVVFLFLTFPVANAVQKSMRFAQFSYTTAKNIDASMISKRQKLVSALRTVGELPVQEKATSMIYIAKSSATFWKIFRDCRDIPFVVPAITGVAMVEGLPSPDCKYITNYTYSSYDLDKVSGQPSQFSEATLCSKVLGHHLRHLIQIVEHPGMFEILTTDCHYLEDVENGNTVG